MGLGGFLKKALKGAGKLAGSPLGQIGLSLIPGGGIVSALARQGLSGLAAKYASGGTATAMPGGASLVAYNGSSIGPPGVPGWEQFLQGKIPAPSAFKSMQAYGKQYAALMPGGQFAGAGSSGSYGSSRRYTKDGKLIRYMNPTNIRAARRAIRRIKSTRRLLQSIEKQLPRRTVHQSFRRAPARRR